MIKVSEALIIARNKVEEILLSAGLLNGLGLTDAEIKAESKVLFWYMANTSETASNKSTYVVYNVPVLTPKAYGDGTILQRRPIITIDIVTNNRVIDDFIKTIDTAFVDSLGNCEVSNIGYKTQEKRFVYELEVMFDVKDDVVNDG